MYCNQSSKVKQLYRMRKMCILSINNFRTPQFFFLEQVDLGYLSKLGALSRTTDMRRHKKMTFQQLLIIDLVEHLTS